MSDQDEEKSNNNELDTADETINDNTPESTDDDVEIIYKKEKNPIVKFLLGFLIFVVIAYIILFITGFVMGWMGINPPTLDNEVLTNQWEKVTGEGDNTEPPSELEKKSPEADNENE